ncbi:sucrase ferredoxin [Corynebacterium nuruki]|jgi:hypothetical protein|nr:sucrase ferredoxin [Corynebacterium nuruki]
MPTTRNPRSGLCSDLTDEPLPGTAKSGRLTLALEYPHGWGRDILDGEALGRDLARRISRYLKANGAQLQFIRRPGRAGQQVTGPATLFIADAVGGTLSRLSIDGPDALPDVDLSTPDAVPGAVRVDHPLLLVCTHGKRDRCCAVKGRPLAGALAEKYPDLVWESSHTKGHRFAPSMILLPQNYSFGRLDVCGADRLLTEVLAGRLPLAGNRGRGVFDSVGQVAELAVADRLAAAGEPVAPGELTVGRPEKAARPAAGADDAAAYAAVTAAVDPELRRRAGELLAERLEMKTVGRGRELKQLKHSDHFRPVAEFQQALREAAAAQGLGSREKTGEKTRENPVVRVDRGSGTGARSWLVTLESRTCWPVVSSCGDAPKEGRSWTAVDVAEVTPATAA